MDDISEIILVDLIFGVTVSVLRKTSRRETTLVIVIKKPQLPAMTLWSKL